MLTHHSGKAVLSTLGFLSLFVFLLHLNRNHGFVMFDMLSFIRDEVVPWIEDVSLSVLGPCPWTPSEHGLSKFSDLKFYVGLTMWALVWHRWLKSPYADRHTVVTSLALKWPMAIGFNLTALSCLQCDSAKGFYWPLIMNCCNAWLVMVRFPGEEILPTGNDGCKLYTAMSIYDDLSHNKWQMRLIFLAQFTLCCVVIFQSYAKYNTNEITLGFWLLACLCVQIPAFLNRGVDSQVGRPWPVEKFRTLMRINARVSYRHTSGTPQTYSDWHLQERFFYGFIVNTLIRDVLIFITPLIFMQAEDGMELVQNALALTFIATFDDLAEAKVIEIDVRYRPPNVDPWQELENEVHEANKSAQRDTLWSAEYHRVWGMVLMFTFPLAMWCFGLIYGITLRPRPKPAWFAGWLVSFWVDALIVLVPHHL